MRWLPGVGGGVSSHFDIIRSQCSFEGNCSNISNCLTKKDSEVMDIVQDIM